MAIALRPLLTATAAGALLCALWFVPSADATTGDTGTAPGAAATTGDDADSGALPEIGLRPADR
ncbi:MULTISPECIES: hypothetical protein [unclassified Streptomyces]|uniref:hypothetical protein n=1 Tax=unclassified Streptomyces TaxID=2593676 RepID=UPI00037A4DF2|nr:MULTISPECIES: hypothetical protein [unclassified Streptomyces]MYQ77882.1 hypothetical protein [Streptomyces sp. SID4923]OKJ02070.1 hypothetical protein AMK18_11695 [Streptomyces sp. CB01249]